MVGAIPGNVAKPHDFRGESMGGHIGMMRLILAALAALLLAPAPAQAQNLEKVVLQLCWDHQFQFAGYYAAQWNGYYEAAGLDVEIRSALEPGFKFINSSREVVAGRADFGVGDANILVARDQGAPLVILAPIFQHSTVEIYTPQERRIDSPGDLMGLRILRRKGDLGEVELQAMLRAEGFDPGKLEFTPLEKGLSSAQSLKQGHIDAILGNALTTPYLLDQAGVRADVMRPSMYGIDFYGDTLFTTDGLVQEKPGMVKRFLTASLKGWEYALTHDREIVERIARDLPRIYPPTDDVLVFNSFQSERVQRLCNYPQEAMGHVNPERWERMHSYLKQTGLVQGDLNIQKLIYDPVRWKQLADERFHNVLYAVLGGTAGCALILFVWTFSLQRVVSARTGELVCVNRQLKDEIAERTRMAEDLRVSESFCRTIFENRGTPMVIVEEDTTISLVNSEFEQVAGYSREEIQGLLRWTQFFEGETRKRMLDYHRRRREEPESVPKSYDAEMINRHGERRYVIVNTDMIPGTRKSVASILDITERNRTEQALRDSEERFRQLVENIEVTFWIRDLASGQILYVSPGFERMWGEPRSAAYERKWLFLDALHPGDRDRVHAAHKDQQKGGLFDEEFRIVRKDGEERWLHVRIFPIRDEDGAVYRTAAIAEDVTERKTAEEEVHRSGERLRLLVDYMPVLIHAHGPQWEGKEYVFWNRESERVTGYPADSIVGNPQAMSMLYPDDEYRCAQVESRHRQGLDYRDWENSVRCADGSERVVAWSNVSNQCPIPGWPTWEIGLDITERKKALEALRESETLYRTITENLPLGILFLDESFRTVTANKTMQEWFPHVDFHQQPVCFSFLGQGDEPCMDCPCLRSARERRSLTITREITLDGEQRSFKIIACPISSDGDTVDRYIVIYSDVTEEQKFTQRMQQAQKTDLIATMGTGIVHEINQPLNALKLWITGLLMRMKQNQDLDRSVILDHVRKSLDATDRIEDVIQHMRRLISKEDNAQPEPTPLNECVRKALNLISAKLAAHKITLRMELAEGDPLVMATPIQLEQVVINLVTNAVDAHDTHQAQDKTIVIETAASRNGASLVVEDNGPGLDGNEERIFDPFFSTKGSLGLGLALVHTFVTGWGGQIRAWQSPRDKGARLQVDMKRSGTTSAEGRKAAATHGSEQP